MIKNTVKYQVIKSLSLTFFILFISYGPFALAQSLSFTPQNYNFEILLGPKGQIISQSESCNATAELVKSFSEWKKKLGEQVGEVGKCQCGKSQVEEQTYEFFKDKLYTENNVRPLNLRKRRDIQWKLSNTCYQDITAAIPEKVQELAKRQLIKDLDKNIFDNFLFDNSGINCFATAMEATGYLDTPRFVSQYEFNKFLNSSMCKQVDGKDLRPGDIISYYRRAPGYEAPGALNGYPIHASVMVTPNLVFEKKGGHRDFPYQLAPFSEMLAVTRGPVAGFRCKTKKDLLEEAKDVKDFKTTFEAIEQIESCWNRYYQTSFQSAEIKKIIQFTKMNLVVIEKTIEAKRTALIDPDTLRPYEGKELEYEYWMLLHAKVVSIYNNLNYNLEFPNVYDYLNEINS